MTPSSGPSQSPAVSVITATYNSSATLRLTLLSLLAQEFADFEALVIGDGCTDDSEGVVAALADPRLRWLNLATNSGSQTVPNNTGLGLARGHYIAFLGHDDLWLPWHLSGLVGFIGRSHADLVHSLVAKVGPKGIGQAVGPPAPGVPYANHVFPPSSWLHRRDLIEACGLWRPPEGLAWPMTFDYSRRVALAGRAIAFFPRLTVLKFPSKWHGGYANTGPPPQRDYLDRIRRDPHQVEHAILERLAINGARQLHGRGFGFLRTRSTNSTAAALAELIWPIWHWLLDHDAHERWPLASFLRDRHQRRRSAVRSKRGLPSWQTGVTRRGLEASVATPTPDPSGQ